MNAKSLVLLLGPLVVACAGARAPRAAGYPDADRTLAAYESRNASLARELVGVEFDATARTESQFNLSGIHTPEVLFSRRIDSRTYFFYDKRVPAAYDGSDDDLVRMTATLLRRVGVADAEIARARVLRQHGGISQIDRQTKEVRSSRKINGPPMVLVERQLGGVPVFSSRVVLTGGSGGRLRFVELHWPEISPTVVAEARRLQALVLGGWGAPERKGARVESVEAGIVHSPAAALVMDVAPVIRVIYTSATGSVGQKPMLFYDRNGNQVAPPRVFPGSRTACADSRRRAKP